ncbi:hypothetical protein F5882DRAFT_506421 [Hyaloscypha sp. PMI_1271]|nr:hypothetical protein F5882DRAFT_506421 [Hyaloscypha sp. PMI_1271]
MTRYCSRDCQSVDWPLHKRSCQMLRTRKDLYRAGSILQQIFYLCHEKLFDIPIHRIEYDNNRMLLHPLPAKDFGPALEDKLFRFPSEQCKTEEDQKALLSYLACSDLTLSLQHIAEYLLGGESQGRMISKLGWLGKIGIATSILEVPVDLKNHRREVVRTNHLNLRNMERHEVLRVVLKHGGEVYALDIASAQYGYYNPIVVWNEFVDTRVEQFKMMGKVSRFTQITFLLANRHTEQALDCIKAWMEENRLSARNLLRLRTGEFELRESELVHFIKGRTRLDTKLVQEAFEITKGAAAAEGRI